MSHHTPITAIARIALLAGVLLAILLLPTRAYQPAHAQDARDETLYYAENGTDEVVSYTAIDPEGDTVTWNKTGTDTNDFDLSQSGELTFKSPPDYETPMGGGDNNSNEYRVTLTASDGTNARGPWTLTIIVTNVDEAGAVSLSTVAPLEKIGLTATLTDPDKITGNNASSVEWQWARSTSNSGPWTDIETTTSATTTTTYTPTKADLRHYLRATASYTDDHGAGKTAQVVSTNKVQSNTVNDAPVFHHAKGNVYADDDGETQPTPNAFMVGQPLPSGNNLRLLREVAENSSAGTAVGARVELYDDDGDVLTYTLTGDGASSFTIDSQTGQIRVKSGTTLNREVDANSGPYAVTVTATDPVQANGSINVVINVTNVSEAPKITGATSIDDHLEINSTPPGGYDYSASLATYSATDDEDDLDDTKSVSWSLSGADGGKFAITTAGALTFGTPPDYEAPTDADKNNSYQVTVIATDTDDNATTRNVTVSVTNVDENGSVTLSNLQPQVGTRVNASLSDPDGSISSLTWKWGTSTRQIWDTDNDEYIAGKTSSSYTPVAGDVGGGSDTYLYAFASYTDGQGANKTASVRSQYVVKNKHTYCASVRTDSQTNITTCTSTRNGNKPPVFVDQDITTDGVQNTQATLAIAENTTAFTTGLRLGVNNQVAKDDQNIRSINPNSTTTETAPESLTYSLDGTDRSSFTINRLTGVLTIKAAPDYEKKKSYSVRIKATDPSGSSATLNVTVNVTDAPEAPDITGGAAAISTPENTATSTVLSTYIATDDEDDKAKKALTWALSGDDSGDFTIGNTDADRGQLKFSASPDRENAADEGADNTYTITITVTDSDDRIDQMQDVTVEVTNVDETGTVTLSTLQPKQGVSLTATLSDPDGFTDSDNTSTTDTIEWQWATSTSESGPWVDIDNTRARSSDALTSGVFTPLKADVGSYLRATAIYTDGHGSGKSQSAVSANTVQPKNYANTAPVFNDTTGTLSNGNANSTTSRSVLENSPAGTAVGKPVAATDIGPDGRQENLTYALSDDTDVDGDDDDFFTIDRQTGQISVKSGTTLDRETKPSYGVVVSARDPLWISDDGSAGTFANIRVTINIADVSEAPGFTDGATATSTPENTDASTALTVLSTYIASDDEDGTTTALEWSLSGADKDQFELCNNDNTDNNAATCDHPADADSPDQTAQLRFKAQTDFESPTDSGRNNKYEVTVTVTDSSGKSASRNVTVTVENVDETGQVILSRVQAQVGTPISATLTDPDGRTSSVKWKWGRSGTYNGDVTHIPGKTSSSYTPVPADVDNYLFATATYTDGEGTDKTITSIAADGYSVKVKNEYCTRTATTTKGGNTYQRCTSRTSGNVAPQFPDQDDTTTGDQRSQTTRRVEENTASGQPIRTPIMGGIEGAVAAGPDNQNTACNDSNFTTRTGCHNLGSNATSSTDTDVLATTTQEDKLTYTLEGTDARSFGIDRYSGMLQTKAPLDYETKNSYSVRVKATDPGGKSATINVTIEVRPVNEQPAIIKKSLRVQGSGSVSFPEDRTDLVVATYTALGPAGSRSWRLSGDDAGDFSISSAGALSFSSRPNFEVPADADTDNEYEVTLTASVTSDGETLTDDLDVTVTVTNAEEAGTVTLSPTTRPRVGTAITAALTDPDSVTSANTTGSITTGVTWQWSKATATSTWSNIAGATEASYTPAEADADNFLRATASYADLEGSGKEAVATTTQTVLALSATPNDGTVTISPAQPVVGTAVTARLTDPDGSPTGLSWQWSSAPTATAATSSWTNISGATSASYTPVAADAGRYLRATASYTDPVDGAGQTAFGTSANAVTTVVAVDEYDRNADGRIDSTEVLEAVSHYFAGTLSQARVLQVVALYFAGLPPTS